MGLQEHCQTQGEAGAVEVKDAIGAIDVVLIWVWLVVLLLLGCCWELLFGVMVGSESIFL